MRRAGICFLFIIGLSAMLFAEEDMNNADSWKQLSDGQSIIKLKNSGVDGKGVMELNYLLRPGGWVAWQYSPKVKPANDVPVVFDIKADAPSILELKFLDADGSTFGIKVPLKGSFKDWTRIVLPVSAMEYWWNGDTVYNGMNLIEFAVSGSGKGKLYMRDFHFGKPGMQSTFAAGGAVVDPDWNKPGVGFKQRRSDTLIPENPLVLEYLKQMQDTSSVDKKLLPAQEDNGGQTFNNALVAMAFILKNEKARAERILDFYANATNKNNTDPTLQNFYYKGEARGFFQEINLRDAANGKAYHSDGNRDRWMGDMAWLTIACLHYKKTYSSDRYDYLIGIMKDLLVSWFKDDGKGGGYVQHGWRRGDTKLHENGGHHEGNIDCYALFKLLGDEEHAKKIRVWLDRELANRYSLPLDLFSWRSLAYGRGSEGLLNIPEKDLRFRKTLDVNGKKVTGFYHSPEISTDNIWYDGVGHMSCAYFTVGDPGRGNFYANQYDSVLIDREINGVATKSIPYTANTQGGFDWVDGKKGFVSVCSWYIYSKNRFNPMQLAVYSKGTQSNKKNDKKEDRKRNK